MARRALFIITLATLLSAGSAFAFDPARCMYCIEKQTEHRRPDDTSGCNRDESGACPSWCNSCS